jgi:hypothetical protein
VPFLPEKHEEPEPAVPGVATECDIPPVVIEAVTPPRDGKQDGT